MTMEATDSPSSRVGTRFWHPGADMAAVEGAELVVSRAEGVWLWDDAGKRYLDGTAGLWCVVLLASSSFSGAP